MQKDRLIPVTELLTGPVLIGYGIINSAEGLTRGDLVRFIINFPTAIAGLSLIWDMAKRNNLESLKENKEIQKFLR